MMAVSGHVNFPYSFGLFNENLMLLEYFGSFVNGAWLTCPNFADKQCNGISVAELKDICVGVLQVVKFMHSKKILHNDIKTDNIVVADRVKLIDFGKATMSSSPLIDKIACGFADSQICNTIHRHWAYELINIPLTL